MALVTKGFKDILSFSRNSEKTYFDKDGVLQKAGANEPAFTHDLVTGESLGLSVHEQRTNLLTTSNETGFGTTGSGTGTLTLTSSIAAPSWLSPIEATVRESEATGIVYLQQFFTPSSTGDLTMSVFVKPITGLGGFRISGVNTTAVDLLIDSSGSVIVSAPTFNNVKVKGLPDGWFRLSATVSLTSINSNPVYYALEDGTTQHGGMQCEQGAFPTPYIPTTTAQVTRQVDVCSIDNIDQSDWWNSNAGTFVVEAEFLGANSEVGGGYSFNDGTANNVIELYMEPSSGTGGSSDVISAYIRKNGGASISVLSSINPVNTGRHKMSFSWDAATMKLSVDGGAVVSNTHGGLPTVTKLGGRNKVLGKNTNTKSIKYKPAAVSDSELQELSTL